MKTVFDPAVRRELLERMEKIHAHSERQFGKMSPDQMVHHVNTAIRANLGDISTKYHGNNFKAAILRLFTFAPIPIPKGKAQTSPEFVSEGNYDLIAEKNAFKELVRRASDSASRTAWPISAGFGKLTPKQYGELIYKHTDHHLQQFGA